MRGTSRREVSGPPVPRHYSYLGFVITDRSPSVKATRMFLPPRANSSGSQRVLYARLVRLGRERGVRPTLRSLRPMDLNEQQAPFSSNAPSNHSLSNGNHRVSQPNLYERYLWLDPRVSSSPHQQRRETAPKLLAGWARLCWATSSFCISRYISVSRPRLVDSGPWRKLS